MKENARHYAVILLLALVLVAAGALRFLLPEQTYSDTERRKLKTMPSLTAAAISSGSFMTDFESYTQDHFPLRDSFRTLKAVVQLDVLQRQDSGGLYRAEGHLSKLEYPLDEESLSHAAQVLQSVADKYLTGNDTHVYLSVIPDKNAFLAAENGYPALDYDALEESLRAQLPDMTYIAVDDLLSLEDYYRTDPHWRQEQITDVAQRLLSAMGADTGAQFTPRTLSRPFYGVYAGQLPLPAEPDSITILEHGAFDACAVYDWENNKRIPVYDIDRAGGRDPYEVYLSGALPLITVENPACRNGRELVVFRDSFGSALTPLLIPSYEKITLVDIRYLPSQNLNSYVTFDKQDVLFLYSTLVLNNSATLK